MGAPGGEWVKVIPVTAGDNGAVKVTWRRCFTGNESESPLPSPGPAGPVRYTTARKPGGFFIYSVVVIINTGPERVNIIT